MVVENQIVVKQRKKNIINKENFKNLPKKKKITKSEAACHTRGHH